MFARPYPIVMFTLLVLATFFTNMAHTENLQPDNKHYVKVEVKGKLEHGIVAIGGETTGTIITANGITWELDLTKQAKLIPLAERLSGRTAVVTGSLTRRAGVEVKERWIVSVQTLKGARD